MNQPRIGRKRRENSAKCCIQFSLTPELNFVPHPTLDTKKGTFPLSQKQWVLRASVATGDASLIRRVLDSSAKYTLLGALFFWKSQLKAEGL